MIKKLIIICALFAMLVPMVSWAQQPICRDDFNNPVLCNAFPRFGGVQIDSVAELVGAFFTWFASIVATLAMVMIMVSGAQMIFAQGDSGVITKAKTGITYSIVGLVLIMSAYIIVSGVTYFLDARDLNIDDPGNVERRFFINPLLDDNLGRFVQNSIRNFLGLLGTISMAYIILSGYKYLTAGGDESKTKSAKTAISYAVTGLVCVILSYVIVTVVINTIR